MNPYHLIREQLLSELIKRNIPISIPLLINEIDGVEYVEGKAIIVLSGGIGKQVTTPDIEAGIESEAKRLHLPLYCYTSDDVYDYATGEYIGYDEFFRRLKGNK